MVGINTVVVPVFLDDDVFAGTIGIVSSIHDIPGPHRSEQIARLQKYAEELSTQLNSITYQKIRLGK